MERNTLHIKNVVCQRCIISVENILKKLDIPYAAVNLGEASLKRQLSALEKNKLQEEFSKIGFEIIQERNEKIINAIKSAIIEEVYSNNLGAKKLSEILSGKMHYDYSHITNLFTKQEGQSIQKFYNAVKIERIKELLAYDEISMNLIADKLGYSTPAYLSTSFKKATGVTPSEYKNRQLKSRKSLDSV